MAVVFRRTDTVAPSSSARLDGLTGLPDRWQVEAWIDEQLTRNRRAGDRFGFFLVSLANLQDINAGYGSAVGDEVLQAVAEALERATATRAHLARYLGSEFALVWPGLFNASEMARIADDLVDAMPKNVSFESFVVPVKILISGVISDPDLDGNRLTVEAESTLGALKSEPSRRVLVRDQSEARRRGSDVLAVRLQRAFDNNEFQLYFQPIVSRRLGSIVGFEAMLRWLAPDAGPLGADLIAPGAFLDTLRSSPVVIPLHAWILRTTMRRVARFSAELTELRGEPSPLFAVANMDPSFVCDRRFVDVVLDAVADAEASPQQLLLDVNANSAGDAIHRMWPPLAEVQDHGVGVALEDYGLGLGSADLLRRCRFDVIRLNRSLVGGLGLGSEDLVIARGIVRLTEDLGYGVIAEGVETDRQLEHLGSIGCDLVQGFLFGKPAADDVISHDLAEIQERAARLTGG